MRIEVGDVWQVREWRLGGEDVWEWRCALVFRFEVKAALGRRHSRVCQCGKSGRIDDSAVVKAIAGTEDRAPTPEDVPRKTEARREVLACMRQHLRFGDGGVNQSRVGVG